MEDTSQRVEGRTQQAQQMPAVNYFEKSIDLVASYDRLFVSLYSALIAGIALLLLNQQVSLWVGAAFLMSWVLFVMDVAHPNQRAETMKAVAAALAAWCRQR